MSRLVFRIQTESGAGPFSSGPSVYCDHMAKTPAPDSGTFMSDWAKGRKDWQDSYELARTGRLWERTKGERAKYRFAFKNIRILLYRCKRIWDAMERAGYKIYIYEAHRYIVGKEQIIFDVSAAQVRQVLRLSDVFPRVNVGVKK